MGPLREHLGDAGLRTITSKNGCWCCLGDRQSRPVSCDGSSTRRRSVRCGNPLRRAGDFESLALEKALTVDVVGVKHVIDFCRKRGAA